MRLRDLAVVFYNRSVVNYFARSGFSMAGSVGKFHR